MDVLTLRAVSALGFFAMIGAAWTLSRDRRRVVWRPVLVGAAIQWALALVLLRTPVGRGFFLGVNQAVVHFLGYTDAGVRFVFGPLADIGFSIVTHVLPIIVFMGSFFAVLYHLGIIQAIVDVLARALSRSMGLSGAECLAAVSNVFVGMVESALVVKPYLAAMTRSELFSLMTLGMATVAGSVLLAYAGMLGGDFAGHLVTASLLSAPAGLLVAKLMEPETGTPRTSRGAHARVEREAINVIDAAALGGIRGLRLAAYVGALLLAFRALIALADGMLGLGGAWVGLPDLTFAKLLGWALAPVALLMGVAPHDAVEVGGLLGLKTVLNEFFAYEVLAGMEGQLDARSTVIASYALCGFANFGSLAILLGGLGGIAPERRGDVAELGIRSIVAGSLTTFMTACIAGALL